MRRYQYYNNLAGEAENPSTAETVAKAISTAIKVIQSVINNDTDVMNLRGSFINVFQKQGLTESNWNPLIFEYQISHADIPNRKLFGNYNEEVERVLLWSVAMFENFFPEKLDEYKYLLGKGVSPSAAASQAFTYQIPQNGGPGSEGSGSAGDSTSKASFGGTTGIILAVLIIGGILLNNKAADNKLSGVVVDEEEG
jgi:hypothetical protein